MPQIQLSNREEWLATRRAGLGASEVPAVLGIDPWNSAFRVHCLKVHGLADKDLGELGEWGIRHEPTIAEALATRTKRKVTLTPQFSMFRHDTKDFLTATPDGFQRSPEHEGIGVLQIKTANEWSGKAWSNGPPAHTIAQVHQEIAVTGLKWGSLVVLVGGNRLLGPFDYKADPVYQEQVDDFLAAWWERHVINREPPVPDDKDATAEALDDLFTADAEAATVELDAEAVDLIDRLELLRKDGTAIESQKHAIKNRLALLIGNATVANLPDGRQLTYKEQTTPGYVVDDKTYRVMRTRSAATVAKERKRLARLR